MNTLDTIYRAFTDYRKTSCDDRECAMQRTSVLRADVGKDVIETIRHTLHIDEDWVVAIEEGLVFVEKAIAEERQFIRNYGEVVPIEKVRHVSRDSVEHLSKHTDLITTEPTEGEPLLPDKLYTVERLSDYAVYENRFLYMLLCYLEQFIAIRYDKIVELANTYRGSLCVDKEIKSNRQNLVFRVELREERRNDPLLAELNPNKSIIERIDMLAKQVAHYKNTPLMQEVKKAPMLHPPVTTTNVLRMNHNFRGAMRLYEFVSAYDKPGYSSAREDKRINPFSETLADEMAEVEMLASFLTYEYGMEVKDILKQKYLKDEEERKRAAEKKKLEKLKALRKRIAESGGDAEEYMLMLEQRNRELEADSAALDEAKKEIDSLKEEIAGLTDVIEGLNSRDEERLAEIKRLMVNHEEEIGLLNAEHEREKSELNAAHAAHVENLTAMHEGELAELSAAHAAEQKRTAEENERFIDSLRAEHNAELEGKDAVITHMTAAMDEMTADHEAKLKAKTDECSAKLAECDRAVAESKEQVHKIELKLADVASENKLLADLKTLSDARLNALRYKHGYITEGEADELTSERAFNEIEHQYTVFTEFFKKTWKRTKKKIRKDVAERAKSEQSARQTTGSVQPEKPTNNNDNNENNDNNDNDGTDGKGD